MRLRFALAPTLVLALAVSRTAFAQQVDVSSGSVVETVAKLHPGEFVWVPEIAPEGPLLK